MHRHKRSKTTSTKRHIGMGSRVAQINFRSPIFLSTHLPTGVMLFRMESRWFFMSRCIGKSKSAFYQTENILYVKFMFHPMNTWTINNKPNWLIVIRKKNTHIQKGKQWAPQKRYQKKLNPNILEFDTYLIGHTARICLELYFLLHGRHSLP